MGVIGPFDHATWATMRLLRSSVEYMKTKCDPKFTVAIEKEGNLYKRMLKESVGS